MSQPPTTLPHMISRRAFLGGICWYLALGYSIPFNFEPTALSAGLETRFFHLIVLPEASPTTVQFSGS